MGGGDCVQLEFLFIAPGEKAAHGALVGRASVFVCDAALKEIVPGYLHDNIWCLDPEKTIQVMRKVEVPWIAFKVLTAGAIYPRQGFGYAFRNGADFVAVGMTDFRVRANVALVERLVTNLKDRECPWRA